MRELATRFIATLILILAPAVSAEAPESIGDPAVANSTVRGDQQQPVAASDLQGGVLLVWRSGTEFNGASQIVARRISAITGKALSKEMVIGSSSLGEGRPAVAIAKDGRFFVAWEEQDSESPGSVGIYASFRSELGKPIIERMRVNDSTAGNQLAPAVAVNSRGDFLVLWQAEFAGDQEIMGKLYSNRGPVRGEFIVNATRPGDQERPAIAANDSQGGWLAAWQGPLADYRGTSIFLGELDARGSRLRESVLSSSRESLVRSNVSIAANSRGTAAAVWQVSDGVASAVFGRALFNSRPLGPEERLSFDSGRDDRDPTIVVTSADSCAPFWTNGSANEMGSPEGSPIVIQGRGGSGGGGGGGGGGGWLQFPPEDAITIVSTRPSNPVVAEGPSGGVLVAWQGTGDDEEQPEGLGVFFQAFAGEIEVSQP